NASSRVTGTCPARSARRSSGSSPKRAGHRARPAARDKPLPRVDTLDKVRRIIDWVVTIGLAVGFVLVFEAEIAKPFRIPSASMEPTLHCAKPGANCEAGLNDRVIANRLAYRFSDPKRGQIV